MSCDSGPWNCESKIGDPFVRSHPGNAPGSAIAAMRLAARALPILKYHFSSRNCRGRVDGLLAFYSANQQHNSVRVCFGSTSAAGVHRPWIEEHHLACRALSHRLRHRMLVEYRPVRARSTTPPDQSSTLPTQRGQMLEWSDREV